MTEPLRIAVLGAGAMGSDHIRRLTSRIVGAEVVAVVDVDGDRAAAAAAEASAAAFADTDEALDAVDPDALLVVTPGQFHEPVLLDAIRRELPVLCEKPLTLDAASALRVVQAEARGVEVPLIQVGFMRRFDAGYTALKRTIDSGELGALLLLHCRHRNAANPLVHDEELLIRDSVVHELDIVPWLTGSPLQSVQVRKPRSSSLANGLRDPQLVLLETDSGVLADVEIFVNAQYGYEVTTEAVFERGVVRIGDGSGPEVWTAGRASRAVASTFTERFADAYDREVQRWVTAASKGTIDGANAWDGYLAVIASEAAVTAQRTGELVQTALAPMPALYG